MSEMTPEQMRTLADDVQHTVDNGYEFAPENVVAALRTAADQLEAGTFDAGYRNGYKVGYMHASGKVDAL